MRAKDLLNPLRHSDHKHAREQVLGLCYIILEILDLYGLMFRGSAYSADPVWFNAMKVTGILVTAAALRNFGHLAKSNVNKGMFAESRTFSYGFLVENLWFQVAIALQHVAMMPCFFGSAATHPTDSRAALGRLGFFSVAMFWFIARGTFPKTSYVDWEAGNQTSNEKKLTKRQIGWINFQVKVVRLNYVLKSQVAVPYFLSLHMRGLLPDEWRFLPLFMSLDIAHNITTAFFLQTLKFHGFLSATAFSFLFNATAYVSNALLVYYALKAPVDTVALLPNLALAFVNLAFVYRKRGDPRLVQFVCFVIGFALPLLSLPAHEAVALLAVLAVGAAVLGVRAQRLTQWGARFTHAGSSASHIFLIIGGGVVLAAIFNPLLERRIANLMKSRTPADEGAPSRTATKAGSRAAAGSNRPPSSPQAVHSLAR